MSRSFCGVQRIFGLIDLSLLRSMDLFQTREEAEDALVHAQRDDEEWDCRLWIAEVDVTTDPRLDVHLGLGSLPRTNGE